MIDISDKNYVLNEQYSDDANLNDRIQLHLRFSTNSCRWTRWLFDRFDFSDAATMLELGSGPADLWQDNLDRIPDGLEITLSDFSPGMVEAARKRLRESDHPFKFEQVDAQSIPFGDATFDIVTANHMLYHIPNLNQALSEIRRVLKPGGRFYAATNGRSHLLELRQLIGKFNPAAFQFLTDSFYLGNGAKVLSRWFPTVSLHTYENNLLVTDADALYAYVSSSPRLSAEQLARFKRHLKKMFAQQDTFHITKSSGLFEAQR